MPTRRRAGVRLDAPLLHTLLGHSFLDRLTNPATAPLRVGSQVWSTHELATQLGVVHTRAARLVSAAAESIGAKNVRDLYQRSSPYTFAGIKGLGETTMYVLWRLFESAGLDPDAWATAGERDEALVSFRSLKEREQKAEKRTRDDERKRKRRRGAAPSQELHP